MNPGMIAYNASGMLTRLFRVSTTITPGRRCYSNNGKLMELEIGFRHLGFVVIKLGLFAFA
jgi:hypothetical protein